jgi:cell wall-associated NlpC family hydrolase
MEGKYKMNKGVLRVTACGMVGALMVGSSGISAYAAGLDTPLAGMSAEIVESRQQKEEAGVVKVAPSEYDTVAIAQVSEYVNIRDAASTESNIVGKLYNNCKAEILGKTDDGWYLIQSGSVTGYVSSQYFVTGEAAQNLAQEVGTETATVKEGTETLMVRSSADSNSEAISMLGDSQKLEVVEDAGDWVKVAVDDDVVGYVSKEYVDCDTEFVEAESIEEVEARQAAIQEAYDRAVEMQEAAYAAMNQADGAEAAYAADMANAALAEAKMLASEQEFDYDAQALAEEVAYVAQDTSVASVWAQEAEAEYERIAAEEAAYAEALAEAEAQAQAEAWAAEQAAQAQAQAESQQQIADQAEQDAAQAWQDAVDAQEQADQNWSEEAQAQADAAAQAAMQAAAEAEAARQQALAEQQAAEQAAQEQAAQQQEQQQSSGDTSSEDTSSEDTSSEGTSSGSGTSSTRQSVVNFALQFVGNPYVYGGTSLTNGADCSGFTQSVMANFGISIPRTAAAQSGAGTPVSLDAIQPGDLLFYNGGGGIGHVTMYIGNGQVVHASNSNTGIIVSSIDYRTPCSARSFL